PVPGAAAVRHQLPASVHPAPPPPASPYTTLFRSIVPKNIPTRFVSAGLSGTSSASHGFKLSMLFRNFVILTTCSAYSRSRSWMRSEEHTSELQSRFELVCRLLLEKNMILVLIVPN